jgi:hypothetical protein
MSFTKQNKLLSLLILYYDQQMHKYLTNCHTHYMFRHYRVILREPVINALPSYASFSNAAVGNAVYN